MTQQTERDALIADLHVEARVDSIFGNDVMKTATNRAAAMIKVQAQQIGGLEKERDTLRAELAALENQEPVFAAPVVAPAQPAQLDTESVLIDGVAYAVPAPVACELLRLHSDALKSTAQPANNRAQDVNAELVEAFDKLYKKYVNLLEAGRDRILELGGTCDPVDVMEMSDPGLRDARTALANARAAQEPYSPNHTELANKALRQASEHSFKIAMQTRYTRVKE